MPNKLLEVRLSGGLCNKLFCLFSACQIAIENNYHIIEPTFGWRRQILFSDIYDIDYFNESLKKYTGGYDLIIKKDNITKEQQIIINDVPLWSFSVKVLHNPRKIGRMDKNCMNIVVLNALRINQKYKDLVNKQFDVTIHLRLESDWQNYSKTKKVNNDETLLIDLNKFIDMYNLTSFSRTNVFFTSGENQLEIKKALNDKQIDTSFFFNKEFEYELNAAINFEICCQSKTFIGITRSTFSNCISLKRACLGRDESYIYNLNDKIQKRIDKGLQLEANRSVNVLTEII